MYAVARQRAWQCKCVRPWEHVRLTCGRTPAQVDNEEAKHYEVERHALFFNDTGAKELYQQYVRYIIGRRNSRTGQLYRDDPTILAWDLINEPRCETWRASPFGSSSRPLQAPKHCVVCSS